MNLPWLTGQEWELFGLMVLADTVATPSTEDVGSLGLCYHTDTQERVWLPLPDLKQSVYRAEFLAVVRALEECQPHEVVSDCKGVVKAVQALHTGRRGPKDRNSDLEQRALNSLLPGQRIRVSVDDFQGNQQADILAASS
eukprot:3292667-Amphidinium_carterae.6